MDKENKPLYKRIIVITNTLLLILFAGVLQLIYPVSQARGEWELVGTIYGDDLIGPLNQPSGIFFDEEKQRVYLADTRNNRLLSYGSNFEFLSEFSAEGKLELPTCIVRDSKKRLIVTESKKNQVTIIDIIWKKI